MIRIPLVAVTVEAELAGLLEGQDLGCPVVALRRIVMPPFAHGQELRKTGPLFVVN